MRKKAYREPAALSDLIPRVLRSFRKPAGTVARVERAWAAAVGPERAGRTRVTTVDNGIVTVEVLSAALKHHLATFGSEEILESLRRELPTLAIREVRYRVGRAR